MWERPSRGMTGLEGTFLKVWIRGLEFTNKTAEEGAIGPLPGSHPNHYRS